MQRSVLIYDGECEFCKSWVQWALKRDADRRLEFISCQSEERQKRFPHVRLQDCEQAMYVVTPENRTFAGGDAVPYFFSAIRGWKWVAFLFKIPGVLQIARPTYRWIARNRSRLRFGKSVCKT
jgi:predicted DCC family thiol-disulfide oxidoreductase YuxK